MGRWDVGFACSSRLIRNPLIAAWLVCLGAGIASGCSKILGIEDWPPADRGSGDADAHIQDGHNAAEVSEGGDADVEVDEGSDAPDVDDDGDADAGVFGGGDADGDVYDDRGDAHADVYDDRGDADADADVAEISPPTAHEIWAHWPMPNPDAAIAGGSDATLPNPMAYDTYGEAGTLLDKVTRLTWQTGPGSDAANYGSAAS
jgi:hypothetical protein